MYVKQLQFPTYLGNGFVYSKRSMPRLRIESQGSCRASYRLLTLLWCNRGKWIQTPQKKTAASPVWANWNIKHLCSVKWQDQAGKQTEQMRAVSVTCSSVIILYIVRNGNCVYCSFVFKCWQKIRNGNTSSHSGKKRDREKPKDYGVLGSVLCIVFLSNSIKINNLYFS